LNVAWAAVQQQQHWMAAIVAAHRDPLFDAANGQERGVFDAIGRFSSLEGSGEKTQSEERCGHASHAACDGTRAVLVACRERAEITS
jgi:hypothetical protein